ncbi:MAG: Inorganic pyrophosphatase [Solobacterium sp.]|nr:Inorganic pyrophosphatase [Solobacterium sp.]
MDSYNNNAYFWQKIDTLYHSSNLVISRHKGDTHPTFKNLIYPTEYGHLKDTLGTSSEGLSVYVGSGDKSVINGIVVAADILIKTVDIKILVGCKDEEVYDVLHFLNSTDFQKTVLIKRGNDIPQWSLSDN